jgi:hypothetical protein
MPNTYLKPDAITAEALRVLQNSLPFIQGIDKQHDKDTTFGGQKRGAALRIRKPNQYVVRDGWALNAQEQNEQSETLTIGTVKGVDMNFTDADLALEINEFSRRFITPAVKRLASEVDRITFEKMVKSTYNQVGVAGTTPSSAQIYLDAGAVMSDFATPLDERKAYINPKAQARTVDGLKGLFNPNGAISKQYTKGTMGEALGLDFYMSQNVPMILNGSRTLAATTLVDGTVTAEGSNTVHIDGFTGATDTISEGEVITLAGIYAVNPDTKVVSPDLQRFVVTADFTAAGSEGDVSVSPAMYTAASGGLQTVSALPQDGAAVTFTGAASTAYPVNLCCYRDAYTFASANLEMPSDVTFKGQMEDNGVNIRILRQFDINNAQYPCRMDIFFGSLAQYSSQACRIIG